MSNKMSDLADKTCVPCKGGVPPLTGKALQVFAEQLPQWRVVDEHHLERTFELKDFRESLAFVNRIGELAEEQWHHPDVYLSWGRVGIKLWTHKIDGLTESDFVLAAKFSRLSENSEPKLNARSNSE